jgi:asparaginyl-tRNA synthetase
VGVDLQSEHECYLAEKYAKKPVIVMNYPKDIKAFYMRVNDDGRTVAAMDVLAPDRRDYRRQPARGTARGA